MKTVPSLKKEKIDNTQDSPEGMQESIHPFPEETNIADGAEFLDDGIRMKDQPYEDEASPYDNDNTSFEDGNYEGDL
jgi:hypothetical protein